MHTPMPSLGDSRTQPSTPCSAARECGGNRSSFGAKTAAVLFLGGRGFLRSTAELVEPESTVSIMGGGNPNSWKCSNEGFQNLRTHCWRIFHRLFTRCELVSRR